VSNLPPPTPPPAGWYPDPSGEHGNRWWDGRQWTGHVQSDSRAGWAVGSSASGMPPDPWAADRSRSRRLVLIGAVLAIGLVGTIVVGLSNAGSRDSGTPLGQVAPGATVPPPLERDRAVARFEAAGCRTLADREPDDDRSHLDPADAPPPQVLYPDRPPHSGRHFPSVLSLPSGVASSPIDERAVLHNMEHGAVVVWFDDPGIRTDLEAWWADRRDLGFTSAAGGAIYVSPMPDVADPPTIAFRAWGVAVDCDAWDATVADAFLLVHFGDRGIAPERNLTPFPANSLTWAD
jgi:hypothetical protein